MSGVQWDYFNKFRAISDKYLPLRGEGDTMASQIITATCKLVYKYYNDGDIYDNSFYLDGFGNDLSSYANWLFKYAPGTKDILNRIEDITSYSEYEYLLKDLIDLTNTEEYLKDFVTVDKADSIYTCEGKFRFSYNDEEDY